MSNGKNDELAEGLRIIANISKNTRNGSAALDELCRNFFNHDNVDYKNLDSTDIMEALAKIALYPKETIDETPLKKPQVIDRSFAKIDSNE